MTPSHRLWGHRLRGHALWAVAGVLALACLATPAKAQQSRSQGTASEAAIGRPPGATRSTLPIDKLSLIEGSSDEWSVSRSDAGCYLMSPRRKSTSRLAIGRHPTLGMGLFAASFALALAGEGALEPVVIRADGREGSAPLAGVMREFGIAPHGEDGIMLGLVARALQFVTGLRIGDRLPSEILTREASWSVDEASRDRALARLNLLLIASAQGGTPGVSTRELLSRAGQVPINADTIAAGLHRLATRIGNVTPDEALARVRQVAGEFAHIDALRDQLLRGAQRLSAVLDRLSRNFRGDGTHKELLMQVRRLAAIGVADLQARFDQADAAVGDITEIVARPDDVIA